MVHKKKALAVDLLGNTYIAGHYADSSIDIGNVNLVNRGGKDILLYKLSSSSGEVVWVRSFGGDGDDHALHIAVDGAGGVYLSGISSSSSISFPPITLHLSPRHQKLAFLAKLDASSGEALWARTVIGKIEHLAGLVATGADSISLAGRFRGANITVGELTLTNSVNSGYTSTDGFLLRLVLSFRLLFEMSLSYGIIYV